MTGEAPKVGDRVRLRQGTAGSWRRQALDRAAASGRPGTVVRVPNRRGAPLHVAFDAVRAGHKPLEAQVGQDAVEALPPVATPAP